METKALDPINEKLSTSGLHIAMVPVSQCDLLEKNARFMRVEQHRQLVANIKRDGGLTSVPFALRTGDRYLILSGNHRVMAAQDAGLTEILLLYTERKLSRAEQVAIQLSHNAIVGQDDMNILRDLYDEITDVVLREYSGLDDVILGRMDPPSLDPLSEEGLEYRVVSIAFLPEEVERAEKLFDTILTETTGDVTWISRRSDYDRLLDALAASKSAAGVKNTATAFGLILDLAEAHIDELRQKEPTKST